MFLLLDIVQLAGPFLRLNILCYAHNYQWVQNSIFPSNGKFIFPNAFSLINTQNSRNIEYFIHYVKFEMWPALFYVNSLYFQQWNSNWEIDFLNSSIDSKLGFLNVGLRLYFELFLNLQKYWKLGFLNVGLGCSFKFLPIHWRVGKLEFLNSAYFQILSDYEGSLSGLVCVGEGESICD